MQTITHRVRSFLGQQGARLEPWAGLDQTYAELHALLERRREDPVFWPSLEGLLRELIEQATDTNAASRLSAPDAELLSSWDVSTLVESLRSALPVSGAIGAREGWGGGRPRAYRSFTRTLSPSVLGGFLLLGLAAAGCTASDDSESQSGGSGGTSTGGGSALAGEAAVGGSSGAGGAAEGSGGATGLVGGDAGAAGAGGATSCVLEDAAVLASTINDTDYDPETKSLLCSCMTSLDQSWQEGLTELFSTGTAEEIATALTELLECCQAGPPTLPFSEADLLAGVLCQPTVVYKGVSFPS